MPSTRSSVVVALCGIAAVVAVLITQTAPKEEESLGLSLGKLDVPSPFLAQAADGGESVFLRPSATATTSIQQNTPTYIFCADTVSKIREVVVGALSAYVYIYKSSGNDREMFTLLENELGDGEDQNVWDAGTEYFSPELAKEYQRESEQMSIGPGHFYYIIWEALNNVTGLTFSCTGGVKEQKSAGTDGQGDGAQGGIVGTACSSERSEFEQLFSQATANNFCSSDSDCALFSNGCSPVVECGEPVNAEFMSALQASINAYSTCYRNSGQQVVCAGCAQARATCSNQGRCVVTYGAQLRQ